MMCMLSVPIAPLPLGYRRVERNRIRFARLHRFAVDRVLAARTVKACEFWSGVMWCCVVTEATLEPMERTERGEGRPT